LEFYNNPASQRDFFLTDLKRYETFKLGFYLFPPHSRMDRWD
jgi:hypothetical protein